MTAERKVLYDAWKATPPCGQSTSADASECLRCLAKKALDAYDAEQLIIKQGGSPTEWMYLSDRVDSTSIINLDTGNILSTREVRVDGDCGLRRQRIEWVSHNIFRELPDFVPLTSEVATLLRKHGQHVNHWNMDPVCLPLEVQSDDPEWQETTKARIMDTLTLVPYEVELLASSCGTCSITRMETTIHSSGTCALLHSQTTTRSGQERGNWTRRSRMLQRRTR